MTIGELTISLEPIDHTYCPYCDAIDDEPATHISGGRCPNTEPDPE